MEDNNKLDQAVENTENSDAESSFVDSIATFISNKHGTEEMNKTYTINEADTGVVNAKDEEDKDLYQDAEGKHAKIDTDEGTEGKDKKNKATLKPKPSAASAKQEQALAALFDGEELSESFMNKASTIFEAAINERITEIEAEIREHYETELATQVEGAVSELSEKLDDYLGYVVDEWVKENELAIERGIKADVTENFINGLKQLFESSYIDIPEEKYELLDGLFENQETLTSNLNEEMHKNMELRKEVIAHRCGEIFMEEAHGLADTEIERLASLVEGVEFENEDQYRDKLQVLKESYFNNTPVLKTHTSDDVEEGSINTQQMLSEDNSGPMGSYVSAIARHNKKV